MEIVPNIFKTCEHFDKFHTRGQTLPLFRDVKHVEDILHLRSVVLVVLHYANIGIHYKYIIALIFIIRFIRITRWTLW